VKGKWRSGYLVRRATRGGRTKVELGNVICASLLTSRTSGFMAWYQHWQGHITFDYSDVAKTKGFYYFLLSWLVLLKLQLQIYVYQNARCCSDNLLEWNKVQRGDFPRVKRIGFLARYLCWIFLFLKRSNLIFKYLYMKLPRWCHILNHATKITPITWAWWRNILVKACSLISHSSILVVVVLLIHRVE